MKSKKMLGSITLLVMILFLVACNKSTSNESIQSGITEVIRENEYTKNSLHQMMLTGKPKTIKTKRTFLHEDAWKLKQIETSSDGSTEFNFWYVGKINLDLNGKISKHQEVSYTSVNYTYDTDGLRTTEYLVSDTLVFNIVEKNEEGYIGEYYYDKDTGAEFILAKYLKDSNGVRTNLIGRHAESPEEFDEAYEYELGNINKITQTRGDEVLSIKEIEYDIFPVTLTVHNGDTTDIYTFSYEFDDVGNWIKCNKYEDNTLIATYERVIEY